MENTVQTAPTTAHGISEEVKAEMNADINNMIAFAVHNGIEINPEVNSLVQNSSIDDLLGAYNLLIKNVAPATPKSIHYTRELYRNDKNKSLFTKLPLVRNLVILAVICLIAFVFTGTFPEVNNDSLDQGIMTNHGKSLLLNLVYLASVSGLGVAFYLLKTVSTSVKKGTLIPEDTIYYVALVVLGVIAGLIMSEIISFYTSTPESSGLLDKSVLALIGGFSSDAIFSILQSIIDRIKSIFVVNN